MGLWDNEMWSWIYSQFEECAYALIQRLCATLLLVSMTGTFVARSSRYEAFGVG
jgi:hypothetical protein